MAVVAWVCDRSNVNLETWQHAVQLAEKAIGTKAAPLILHERTPTDVLMFRVDDGASVVEAERSRLLNYGAYLFIAEHGFERDKDILGLAQTTDKFRVVQLMDTDGANYGHDNVDLIAWLRDLDQAEPFELIGAGFDYVEGFFKQDVRDPHALAHRIYDFCPDFVDQGLGLTQEGTPEELIVRHFAGSRSFFFWWD